jgi:hypothetical protein
MYSDNKQIRDVADVAARIMSGQQPVTEKLHPNQQQLDVHEPEKDELTADDFKKLRAKKEVKKEEVEQIDELSKTTLGSYANKATKDASTSSSASANWAHTSDKAKNPRVKAAAAKYSDEEETRKQKRLTGVGKAVSRLTKEEEEQEETILEYETNKDGKFVHNAKAGRYGGSEKPQDPFAGVRGPGQKDLEKIEAEKKKKQKKFSEMVNLYQEKGLKSLSEMLVKEEPDNEEFTKELEDAKAKSEGKKKNTDIAKGKVDAVKQEEVEQIDELSKDTLTSYVGAAKQDNKDHADSRRSGDKDEAKYAKDRMVKRSTGIGAAQNRLNKEEVEELDEREMTDAEKEKKEDIVKGMKKGMAGFKERYGSRANDVMYATATKQAMK